MEREAKLKELHRDGESLIDRALDELDMGK